ncbi:uncharacterized protein LOC129607016 [Condylostylus longicornis]|uniref:uncharacterized protein LOC129607016 n=1 Tax=Condylostylus longicornis TaxID=2530218 RepID=UPI00244E2E59|nr:uncharacterized protein LOC129607016 [Condylostylus longicornis]
MASVENNVVYGGPVSESITSNAKSFGEFFLQKFKEAEDKVILIDGVTDEEFTARQLRENIIKMAYCLENLGIGEGDVVSICSENRVEFIITLFATFCLNATIAPLNVTYSERELDHAINLSKPKVIFSSNFAFDKIVKIFQKNKFVKNIVAYDKNSKYRNISSFWELLNDSQFSFKAEYYPKPADLNESVLLILCSSGTTGMPKGVQLSQKNILYTFDQKSSDSILEMLTLLSVIPWFHSYGCVSLILITVFAMRLVFLPRFEEKAFLRAIEKHSVQLAFMVPPLMVFLAKHPMIDNYDLSSLVGLMSGAAPLSKDVEDAVKERIGISIIRQGYGLSESTLSLLAQNDSHCKPGSVGALVTGHWAKVIDTETGEILGSNKRGELCFKGPCIMKGYIGDADSTQTIIKDGWLHTGDIGYYDENLEFFIVDRIKELIKYKAFQVPPAEIEALLLSNPKIKDAAVVGLPDDECGELPFAFVVKQPGVILTENEVIDFVKSRTSAAKRLRGGVQFIDEIPKNPSGKILRRYLRDMLKNRSVKSKL